MPPSYFDRNQNLQINGDVTFVSSGGSTHDDPSFFQVSQRVQATNAQARVIERAEYLRTPTFQGFKLLCDNTSPSAQYGSGESFADPRCHPGTRIAVQDYIFKWLDDPDGQIAMWMNGPVGIGKSAIAQTVAHQAAERGQLSSAFFFFRSDDTRNSAKYLVPTLAYEMTQQIPHTLDLVCQIIGANPILFSSRLDLNRQISSGLLRPLCTPSDSSPRRHMLIIIDGLDECLDTETQPAIIRSFILSFLRVAKEIIPHKILIVSRPESHIASAVSAADINPHVEYLSLDSWSTSDDIGIYLRAKLDEIKDTHPLKHYLPDLWPDSVSFWNLRVRSLGSFAYASVTIRYLASHNNNPERALQDLLSLRPTRAVVAFADLDALYRHILLGLDEETRFILQKVLCLYVYSSRGKLDDLAARLLEDKSMVELALLRVSSLVQISKSHQFITFHHTSFEEFLRDKERSGDLYVFSTNVAGAVAQALSSLWLHPLSNMADYWWFDYISTVSRKPHNNDMYLHVINILVATKIPASFLYPFSATWEPTFFTICGSVGAFIKVILERRDDQDSNSTHQCLLNDAYNVMCAWLRSHFNLFFGNAPTPNDVLDILLGGWQSEIGITAKRYPFLHILYDIPQQQLFSRIVRIFPDIGRGELFSCILERYLALLPNTGNDFIYEVLTVPNLYALVLDYGGRIPSFCQKLEQIILTGQRALGAVPSPYVTPRDYIFRFFYGEKCYIDSNYQMAIGNRKVSDIIRDRDSIRDPYYQTLQFFKVAGRTDRYIRQAHREHEFAYISEDVENIYRIASPEFLADWDRKHFRKYYALEEL
ncbi:hypothetical protein D9619_005121 [Psilocybe cf. subviscida]|uniref:Nephrocystin 3-like N-terminal domain-containing protein n=1 Tax=Psilocybe cf. subviscida TaxID=2480587 RepID=A0A8H5BNT5_9AGAR|nr:hypothetical protein D9619_005121 [Psilocybe cf. subviscida]